MSGNTVNNSSQALIDADPTQMSGTAGIASAESARLMAALELLNGKFKQDQMMLLKTANDAAMSQAGLEEEQGTALAVGAGISAGAGALSLLHGGYKAFSGSPAEKQMNAELKGIDEKLKVNQMKLSESPTATVLKDRESAAEGATRLNQQPAVSKEQLRMERESLKTQREDAVRKGSAAMEKENKFDNAKAAALQAVPQAANNGAQAASQAKGADATRQKALNQLTTSAEGSLDSARKDLNQTATSFNQINFFAAAVAASRA